MDRPIQLFVTSYISTTFLSPGTILEWSEPAGEPFDSRMSDEVPKVLSATDSPILDRTGQTG